MPSDNLVSIRRRLLAWYHKTHRDLPWRRTANPYAIWIAETMLQQTQVATVMRHYERFLKAFPTIKALDRAPLRKVLALWSGLGYYRRAENLKRSARKVVSIHGGRLPRDYHTLLSLPGIGSYTAGALMSIAFGQRYPALDGNARRVLSRVFKTEDDRALRQKAAMLLPNSQPGYFNQGLMELGARICLPRTPRCADCPLAHVCATRTSEHAGQRVQTKLKPAMTTVLWPVAIVRYRGRILLRRRSNSGILRGLWELPGGEKQSGEDLQSTLSRHLGEIGTKSHRRTCIGQFRHSVTYRRIRSSVFLLEVRSRSALRLSRSRWRWVPPSAIFEHPVSSMTHKALKLLPGPKSA